MRKFDANSLRARIEQVLGLRITELEISFKAMFGGITGYTCGRNFVSLSSVGLALKLSEDDRAALLKIRGAKPLRYDAAGPPSKTSVVVPDSILDDDEPLRFWLNKSILHCRSLPLKTRRPARARGSAD
jgi:TfoX/Sxy family transcriptional regulator of competence genes